MSAAILTRREGAIGRLSLNRPKALHSLTREMCEKMSAALLEWRGDDAVKAVIIDHAGGRGFCAGGDVVAVRQSALEDGGAAGRAFFLAEYRLNHLLFTYPKPVIAFMDGVTMGGGVGIALPAQYRIATENTLFAMPEGSIGLFPDVGAGWYLPRLPGQTGKFLALTGARLDGAEAACAGLATHYLDSDDLSETKDLIAREPAAAEEILSDLASEPPNARIAANAPRIDRLFAAGTLEEILLALAADPSGWAAKELKAVRAKCPVTCKVALRQFAQSPEREDFAAEMVIEYRLAARMIMRHDFIEGVRAVLVDKDNAPRWKPARPEAVDDALVEALFAPLDEVAEWSPLAVSF